jgi:hypothetical protein
LSTASSLLPSPATDCAVGSVDLRTPMTTSEGTSDNQSVQIYNDEYSRFLENVISRTDGTPSYSRLTNVLNPEVVSLDKIVRVVIPKPPAVILIPYQDEAQRLFGHYIEHLDALQHIIHVPTVRSRIDVLYGVLKESRTTQVTQSHTAVLLAILANIAGFWAMGNADSSLFRSREEALGVSKYWTRCALDVLDQVWRSTGPDLETIQSKILLMFLIYHVEGMTGKARHLMASAIADAKDLSLHMTDGPHSRLKEETQAEIIDVEMRRRVWWHLTATDWSAALFAGSHDGVYTIHPDHMHVNKPRNVTDEDLMTQPADFARPCDEPTSTTYYLSRIVLAKICREVADTMLEIQATSDIHKIPYVRIRELDARFSDLLAGLPAALRLDNTNEQDYESASNVVTHHPHLKQKYFTYLTTEARRCKLHLPYLLRVQQNQEFNFSRERCLEAARNVLRLKYVLPSENSEHYKSIKMIGMMHHFCCAIIILVMDLCVNRGVGDEQAQKAEIRSALQIVENAKGTSWSAGMFLESLLSILGKHHISLDDGDDTDRAVTIAQIGSVKHPCGEPSKVGAGLFPQDFMNGDGQVVSSNDVNMEQTFDEMWQSFLDFDADPQAWNAIFAEVGMETDMR